MLQIRDHQKMSRVKTTLKLNLSSFTANSEREYIYGIKQTTNPLLLKLLTTVF